MIYSYEKAHSVIVSPYVPDCHKNCTSVIGVKRRWRRDIATSFHSVHLIKISMPSCLFEIARVKYKIMNLVGKNLKGVKQSMFSDAMVLFLYDLGNLTVCVC